MRIADFQARLGWLRRNRAIFAEREAGPRPRLLVDVSVIIRHDAQTGIQRVVRAVWSELRSRDGLGFDLVPVFATSQRGYCYAPLDFLFQPVDYSTAVPVRARPGDRFLGLDLAAQYLPKYRVQLQAWRNAGATVHLIVYDLLPLSQPQWFNRKTVTNYKRWFDVLVRDADQAICISRQVARELGQRIGKESVRPQLDIAHMAMGGDISASCPTKGLSDRVVQLLDRMRSRPAILQVGTIEPRKGYDMALAAFEHLWKSNPAEAPDMVIVGKPGWKTEDLQLRLRTHREHGKRLHWLDDVSDEGLCQIYAAARGVLMASHGEGFGLPLLEAASHGRPVLARDLPVFREQNLSNVTFFADDRREALAAAIMTLITGNPQPVASSNRLPTWAEGVDGLLATLGLGNPREAAVEALGCVEA